ncbi:hypothetical protein EC991_010163 [Linnemannia zychae]|nr:hypothetical protein EC991_010163 [Linnemannia zychae]
MLVCVQSYSYEDVVDVSRKKAVKEPIIDYLRFRRTSMDTKALGPYMAFYSRCFNASRHPFTVFRQSQVMPWRGSGQPKQKAIEEDEDGGQTNNIE